MYRIIEILYFFIPPIDLLLVKKYNIGRALLSIIYRPLNGLIFNYKRHRKVVCPGPERLVCRGAAGQ